MGAERWIRFKDDLTARAASYIIQRVATQTEDGEYVMVYGDADIWFDWPTDQPDVIHIGFSFGNMHSNQQIVYAVTACLCNLFEVADLGWDSAGWEMDNDGLPVKHPSPPFAGVDAKLNENVRRPIRVAYSEMMRELYEAHARKGTTR